MYWHKGLLILLVTSVAVGFNPGVSNAEDEDADRLEIAVGAPTVLTPHAKRECASLFQGQAL